MANVMEHSAVVKMYEHKLKQPVQFGKLETLWHEKHSGLNLEEPEYKGRVVFRGDKVKDGHGYYAVFSEQGTCSSHMSATKMLDALARCPDCDGEDSDAQGAYTQVKLCDVEELLEKDVFVHTWVHLPRNRWPPGWEDKYDKPVVKLQRNLYGHKLAGLLWFKFAEKIILEAGFEKVIVWECLYYHREKKLFLSIYVDDLKMAGLKINLGPMWGVLGRPDKGMKIDPAVKLVDNQYLGSAQRDINPAERDVERMGAALSNFSVQRGAASAQVAHPELRKDFVDTKFTIDEKTDHVKDEAASAKVELNFGKQDVDYKKKQQNYDPTAQRKQSQPRG